MGLAVSRGKLDGRMSPAAKAAGWVTAFVIVAWWAWNHVGGFNGASLLLILVLSAVAVGWSQTIPERRR